MKKIEILFQLYPDNTRPALPVYDSDTMAAQQQQQQQQQQEQHGRQYNNRARRYIDQMEEYEIQTNEWNQSNQVQEMRTRRSAAINNTPAYYTGDRIHHIRSIQMHCQELWDELFGNENPCQALMEYAQASLDSTNDQTDTHPFAGQMDVSLLMQENFRPGVHVANFVVHLTPHRQFHDGHLIQMEFGEGSQTHQTVSRMFGVGIDGYDEIAIVQQATEYQMLEYLATDDDAMELLHSCFLQPDFAPMRFAFVEPDYINPDDYGYYIQNQNAGNNHRWHEFADVQQPFNGGAVAAAAVIRIPPPVQINNFVDIYQEHLRQYDQDNIIPYDSEDEDEDCEDEDEDYEDDNAQG